MKLSPEILSAIQEAALAADLPISIVTGIVCQESSGKPSATRYEPAFFRRYIASMGQLSDEERKGRATSWGVMQVMGQVAREMGFKGDFDQLLDPVVGLYWGCRHLAAKKAKYFKEHGWQGVIASYNAGCPRKNETGKYVNQYYVDRVTKFASEAVGGE